MSKLNKKHRETIRTDDGDRETYSFMSMERYVECVIEDLNAPVTDEVRSSIIEMYRSDVNEVEAAARINGDSWANVQNQNVLSNA